MQRRQLLHTQQPNNIVISSVMADGSVCVVNNKEMVLYLAPTKSVHVWQVDFITEQHKPFVQLERWQNESIWSLVVLAVMIESLQHQLRCCGTGEVQPDDLHIRYHIHSADLLSQIVHGSRKILFPTTCNTCMVLQEASINVYGKYIRAELNSRPGNAIQLPRTSHVQSILLVLAGKTVPVPTADLYRRY